MPSDVNKTHVVVDQAQAIYLAHKSSYVRGICSWLYYGRAYLPPSKLSDVNTTLIVAKQAFILSTQTLAITWVYIPSNSPSWRGGLLKFIQIAFKIHYVIIRMNFLMWNVISKS